MLRQKKQDQTTQLSPQVLSSQPCFCSKDKETSPAQETAEPDVSVTGLEAMEKKKKKKKKKKKRKQPSLKNHLLSM